MVSALGIVVRIGVNVRVGYSPPCELMQMGKESIACVVTHKKRYEKGG